jgi:Domain of unknown function (DUF4055)
MPTTKSPVEFQRPEYEAKSEIWLRIRAACDGEEAVKNLAAKVLPMPNAEDRSPDNVARYNAYLGRSVWYNVTGRTLDGMVGFVFQKNPVVKLPNTLKVLEENVDGAGVSLHQQAKAALRNVLSLGRCGLLVDYPTTSKPATQADLAAGNVAPTIVLYDAEQITNWRTSSIGAKTVLDLLVLRETIAVPSEPGNEFSITGQLRYRVLTRSAEGVQGRIFVKKDGQDTFEEDKTLSYAPLDKSGKPLSEIPFVFVGAENNDSAVDMPPLLDLANLNFAHFRNSADYEESCYMVGQPTPYLSGLTEQWVKEVLNGRVVLGSRAAIALPVGGTAGLLQASPNTLPKEAMEHKERQMVALGAKLVEQKEVQRTATEAGMEAAAELSTLSACALNVFVAYKAALKLAGLFVNATEAEITYDTSEPISSLALTPEQASAVMSLWMGNLIDFEEARKQLKRAGWAWKDDDEVQENNAARDFDLAQQLPGGDGNPPGRKPTQTPPAE